VKIISDDIIRVRLAPIGVFLDDFSYAVVEQEHEPHVHEVSEDDKNYHVSTNEVTCNISKKDVLVSFSDAKGKLMNAYYSTMHWEDNMFFGVYCVYVTNNEFNDEVYYCCV